MNGGQESGFDGILMMGIHKKHDAIQKQKCSIDDKNEWENTHNNQPPHASVLWQKRNKGNKLFWMADSSAKQNRLTSSLCSESNLFRLAESCCRPMAPLVRLFL
jgi:hypothetical protein